MLLPAANLLQMLEVRSACCDFLQLQLHPSNCLGIRAFSDLHACQDLYDAAQAYTEQHFRYVTFLLGGEIDNEIYYLSLDVDIIIIINIII